MKDWYLYQSFFMREVIMAFNQPPQNVVNENRSNKPGGGFNIPFIDLQRSAGAGIPFVGWDANRDKRGQAPTSTTPKSDVPGAPVGETPPGNVQGANTLISNSGYNPADTALIEAGITNANTGLGLLDQQTQIGQSNINNGYNSTLNRLLGSKAQAEQQYNTTRDRSMQDNLEARSQIDASVGRNANALQRLLGSRGAGNSDAARIAAPYAAAFQGTQQRSGVERDFSRNMSDLDTNFSTFNTGWDQSREDLDRQKFQQEQQLRAQTAEKRASLLGTLGELNARRAAARGGNSAGALAAAQPFLSQANALQGDIVNLGAQYANPINVQAPTYANPELSQYQYDTNLQVEPGQGSALTDTISPAFASLLGSNRRKQTGLAY